MTCDFRWIVSSVAHLPAAACTTWAPGSKPPLGRGGEVGQRALRVLMNFPVVSVRLCETEASWRRAGGETQTEASWGRDADGGGGEMADAGERRGRDGGEMEARRGRDGGGDATRVAATRVARAARLATNTNPNPNQSAEPRLLAAAPNQSIQHSK